MQATARSLRTVKKPSWQSSIALLTHRRLSALQSVSRKQKCCTRNHQVEPTAPHTSPSMDQCSTLFGTSDTLGSVISNDATGCQGCQQPPRQSQQLFWPLAEARLEKTTLCVCHQRFWCTEAQLSPYSLLYGWEAWVLCRRQVQLLERFHQRFLRSIMDINWQDYMINIEILKLAKLPSIEALLLTRQLRWAGHLSHMDDTRMPKAVFYGELRQGKRDTGAPRKRFSEQLKQQLSAASIQEKLMKHFQKWEKLLPYVSS